MRDFVDGSAFNFEQGQRARKLFAAVVLAALDDAIADDKKYGNGPEQIARWALVVLWMAVIFVFSADMGTDSSAKSNAIVDLLRHCGITMDTDTLSFLVRKAGHAFVYLVLGILSLRAFHSTTISPGKMSKLTPCSTSRLPDCDSNATRRSRTLSRGSREVAFIGGPSLSDRGRRG